MPPAPPSPVAYLTTGQAGDVSCLAFQSDLLVASTVQGWLQVFSCVGWSRTQEIKACDKGILWVDFISLGNTKFLLCQGRWEGVLVFKWDINGIGEKITTFNIQHTGFCSGIQLKITGQDSKDAVEENYGESILEEEGKISEEEVKPIFALPTDQSNIIVITLFGNEEVFLKKVSTLKREDQGSVMCLCNASRGKLLAGYEGGDLVLWDWASALALQVVNLSSQLGTVLSLAWEENRGCGLIGGSEAKLVSLDSEFNILKEREITNAGVADVALRGDRKLAVTGGWDGRIRAFSWLHPNKLKPLAVLQYHSGSVEALLFTEVLTGGKFGGKSLLVGGGKGGKISFWDIFNK